MPLIKPLTLSHLRSSRSNLHIDLESTTSPPNTIMIVLIRKDRKEQPSMDLDSPTDQSQSRLLALPAELRNCIWQLLLVQSTQGAPAIRTYISTGASETVRRSNRFCANVLKTCKTINYEATPILYGENVFRAHPSLLAALPSLLRIKLPPVTHPRVAKLIQRYYIHVRLDTDPRFSKRQVEESFTGVEELELDVFQAMYGSCDFTVLKLFEGVRGVGRARVQGSIGDGQYANWLARTMEMPPRATPAPYHELYIGGSKPWEAWINGNR